MNYYEVRDWVEQYIPNVYGKEELGLARIEYLLKLLGDPQNKFKSIHVAGTAGKGSTCWYIAQLLQQETGNNKREIKIGLHTSPHLVYIGERMQINGAAISIVGLIRLMGQIRPIVEKIEREKPDLAPSYFEILVAASFLYFAQEKVDFAVVEVGLGGRLDATNVLQSSISVITNIGLDHVELLGNTISKIAFEKAGIIKKNVPVVTGASGKALQVIATVARERQAPLIKVNTQKVPKELVEEPFWQSKLLALEVVKQVAFGSGSDPGQGRTLNSSHLDFGSLSGRLEWIEKNVLLDGAHNPDKIRFLIESIGKFKVKSEKGKVVLVLAFKKGKDWKKMVDLLVKKIPNSKLQITNIIATQYQTATDTGFGSAVEAEEISRYIKSKWKVKVESIENSQEAVFYALQTTNYSLPTLVLVTGSLYLVGEVRTMWKLPTF